MIVVKKKKKNMISFFLLYIFPTKVLSKQKYMGIMAISCGQLAIKKVVYFSSFFMHD